jgi:hypothetical protein
VLSFCARACRQGDFLSFTDAAAGKRARELERETPFVSLSFRFFAFFYYSVDYHYTTSQKQVETVYTTLLGAELKVRADKITLSLQGKEKRQ